MKKCAVVGASGEAIPMIDVARKYGLAVVGMDGNPDAVGLDFVDEKIVVDLKNVESVVRLLRENEISFLLPVPVGQILTTIGYANSKLGFKGIGYDAALVCADKWLFHKLLSDAGLRVIEADILNNNLLESLCYPKIVKPRFGSGSRAVKIVNSANELKEFIAENDIVREQFVIESLISGDEFGLDGAVIDGKVYVSLLRKKWISAPPNRQALGYLALDKDKNKKIYDDVHNYMSRVINVLNINNCIIHADLMIDKDFVTVIEMAGRPSGHNINKLFLPMATGISIVEEFIRYCLGKEYNFEPERYECIAESFFTFENVVVEKIPSGSEVLKNEWLLDYVCNIEEGNYLGSIVDGHSVVGRGYFIVKGDNEADLKEKIKLIHSQFNVRKYDNTKGL